MNWLWVLLAIIVISLYFGGAGILQKFIESGFDIAGILANLAKDIVNTIVQSGAAS